MDPDDIVQVSIFVNGRKVVQIECNIYRPDLKEEGIGEGRHGFLYDFPVKLDDTSNKRIAVRFAETGAPLGHGEVILSKGVVSALPSLEARSGSVLMRLPTTVPAPASQRALFEMLALLEPEYGIYDLLRRIDFGGWTAMDAQHAAFGRLAKPQPALVNQPSSFVRDYLNDLLFSEEFQRSIIPSLLEAYADKRRLLFVHIPKCAGSDLSTHLLTRYPSLHQKIMLPEWTSTEELFRQLREFVEITRFSDTVFLRGHIALNYYLENQLARPSDRLFSIVRDPMEIAVSSANYVTMRIRQDFERKRLDPDTKKWLKFLGIEAMPNELSDEFAAQVCTKALYNQNIVIPNSMCHWLGGGDAQTVLERLAEYHVEITDTIRYNRWLLDGWGITSTTRENESIKFMTAATLKPEDHDYLREISSEDIRLYAALQNGLTAADRAWVVGRELLAG